MRSASGLAVVCAIGVLGTAVAQAQDRSFHFDIATQSLSQALRTFAHTCGQEVVFTEDVVAGQATSLQHVKVTERGNETVITFQQPCLDKLGSQSPVPDDRFSLTSTYVLSSGRITRTDIYTPKGTVELNGLRMEFATYSDAPVQKGGTTTFGRGAVRKFEVSGFDRCGTAAVQEDVAYHAPTGPLMTKVLCESAARTVQAPLKLSWTLSYQ
jgi:hypothetical protein